MRADIVAAERAREVRDSIRAWRRAGFVSEECEAAALARYPDDRQRFGLGFRTLAFIFTIIAAWAIVGLAALYFLSASGASGFFAFWAVVMAAATEVQRGAWKRASAGAETATAWMAVLFAVVACVASTNEIKAAVLQLLIAGLLLCAAAAWRWGDAVFFLGAAVSAFGLLTQADFARILWIVAAGLLLPLCLSASRESRLGPSHRFGAVLVGLVSTLALYGALHLWSWDKGLIEDMNLYSHRVSGPPGPEGLRPLALVATALLPPAFLLLGWRRREPWLLHAGLLLIGVSIATIRLYRAVMPLSFALILIGASCIVLALLARRFLRSGDAGERSGFTADPLLDNTNRTEVIRVVTTVASFTPTAQAAPERGGFEGAGGGFGGGGATGRF